MEPQDHVTGLLYETAVDPSLWPVALGAFADGVQAIGATLLIINKRDMSLRTGLLGGAGVAPTLISLYVEHYKNLDPLVPVIAAAEVSDRAMLCHDYVSQAMVDTSEYYQDFLIPNGDRYMAGWKLEDNDDRMTALALHARKRTFNSAELAPWKPVIWHFRNALALGVRLSSQLAGSGMLRDVIDHQKIICFMVDANGRVLDCSAAAAELLQRDQLLSLHRTDRLTASTATDTRRLRDLILRSAIGAGGGVIRLADGRGNEAVLNVTPIGVARQNSFDKRYSNCAIVFVSLLKSAKLIDRDHIRAALNCTQAEAGVAADLVQGLSPREVAARRNVSINTLRTQIRMLLTRKGFHRIAELVSFLTSLR